ncbi:MAG TPA: CpaF family protein [Acidimicrobiales bacterium]|nr:CpaF family protein [Acidimicrobiales bacterium]
MTAHLAAVAGRVHARLLEAPAGAAVTGAEVARLARGEAPLLGPAEVEAVVAEVLARATGLGPLEPLLADPAVTEVMVSGPGRVWVERAGALERVAVALDGPAIEHLIEKVVGPLGLRADRASPMVDARLPDGSRVNAVVPPLAVDGPCLTIRRFSAGAVPLAAFCPPGVAALLGWAVRARMNMVIAGGTSSGKTTLLNALAAEIPAGERIVTVEDAAELRLVQEHVVRLEARPPNAEGAGEVRVRDLVRNALRMRPDRIIVGEVRDAAALDMLQAMNTGHEGSLSTCHANSPADALRRLETMVLLGDAALPLDAVREQLVASLDLVVQVARRPGGGRRVVAVAEVAGEAGAGGGRVVSLAAEAGVVRLPARPPRGPATPPPDPAWIGTGEHR